MGKKSPPKQQGPQDSTPESLEWLVLQKQIKQTVNNSAALKNLAPTRKIAVDKENGKIWIVRKGSEPESCKSVLKREVKKSGLDKFLKQPEIYGLWNTVVGEENAQHTRVLSYRAGILTVEVFNSPLLQELRQFHRQSIVESIRPLLPQNTILRDIVFRPGVGGESLSND